MKSIRLLIIASLIVVALGCSTVSVQYDHDTEADFTSLKTFDFLPVPEEANISTLNVKRVKNAIHTQLTTKGCRMVTDNPDFLIAMHLTKEQKKLVIVNRGYMYSADYNYWGSLHTREYEYEEGTFVLDFVDTKSKELIWRGVAQGEIHDDFSPEKRIKRIEAVIQKVLSNFPPVK